MSDWQIGAIFAACVLALWAYVELCDRVRR
jgi:hypothetical protein